MAKSHKPKSNRRAKSKTKAVDPQILHNVSQDTPPGHPDHNDRLDAAIKQSKADSSKTS